MVCYCSPKSVTLTLGILETPKWVLWQAVKTQLTEVHLYFGSSSLWPIDMYSEPSQYVP